MFLWLIKRKLFHCPSFSYAESLFLEGEYVLTCVIAKLQSSVIPPSDYSIIVYVLTCCHLGPHSKGYRLTVTVKGGFGLKGLCPVPPREMNLISHGLPQNNIFKDRFTLAYLKAVVLSQNTAVHRFDYNLLLHTEIQGFYSTAGAEQRLVGPRFLQPRH